MSEQKDAGYEMRPDGAPCSSAVSYCKPLNDTCCGKDPTQALANHKLKPEN